MTNEEWNAKAMVLMSKCLGGDFTAIKSALDEAYRQGQADMEWWYLKRMGREAKKWEEIRDLWMDKALALEAQIKEAKE